MKSELRKILEAFISDSTFYGEVGPEVVEAENQAVEAILELFNKQVGKDLSIDQPFDDRLDNIEIQAYRIFRKGANWAKADIRRAAGLEEK